MTTKQIFQNNNKALEQSFLSKIKELPNHKIKPTTVNDMAYFEPIVMLNDKQNTNFKNLVNANN